MNRNGKTNTPAATELRRRAEAGLRKSRSAHRWKARDPESSADTRRLLHELQVHQIELEMQNTELKEARDRMEVLLDKYTDLYDFAPVGYFSLDEQGRILEVNLTGAVLLGVERSRLIGRPLPHFVVPSSQPAFLAFLEGVFTGTGKQVCEAPLLRKGAADFWAGFHGVSAISVGGPRRWCRLAISDITPLKRAEEAQRNVETLSLANRELRREILRRQAVEDALKKSEQNSRHLLEQSRSMQEQLRLLSRQLLSAQEEERIRISRELHDVIAQALTGINVRLASLKTDAKVNAKDLERNITRTQRLVEKSVNIVHRFARELRPTVLDDLGLIPALHSFMKELMNRTGIRMHLVVFTMAYIKQLNSDKRTVLYRVAQEALTNVARHAHASHAEVKIEKLNGVISMRIEDDGKGFREERVLHAKRNKRLGLLGMRERLEMVGGNFTVTSMPGKGTTIVAQIPLNDRSVGGGGSRIDPVRGN